MELNSSYLDFLITGDLRSVCGLSFLWHDSAIAQTLFGLRTHMTVPTAVHASRVLGHSASAADDIFQLTRAQDLRAPVHAPFAPVAVLFDKKRHLVHLNRSYRHATNDSKQKIK